MPTDSLSVGTLVRESGFGPLTDLTSRKLSQGSHQMKEKLAHGGGRVYLFSHARQIFPILSKALSNVDGIFG